MGNVYINQTYLRIELTADVSVNDALVTKIYFRRPSGTEDSVDATTIDAEHGVLVYDLNKDEEDLRLDESGWWTFWTYVEFADGRIARGEPLRVRIFSN